MKNIIVSNNFKKDLKRIKKRGVDLETLLVVYPYLASNKDLPKKFQAHKLIGNYMGFWECHIKSDWILIYDIKEDYVELVKTGTHSDLFIFLLCEQI
mgnify:CR=1 FL=1|tara:strand:+ start:2129 stop:2419 length:291 start_codon:yes stop_codon:yes gene_type:complete